MKKITIKENDFSTLTKDYFNIKLIKQGGQKKVYQAKHKDYGDVVIKIGVYNSIFSLERILREVTLLKKIDSKYYPKNYDFFINEQKKHFLIVEEFINGKTLDRVTNLFSDEKTIIVFLRKMIQALEIIWSQNVVHRDLKPQNILLKEHLEPCIIDLGIARFLDLESLTRTIALMGPCTPIYASPEQLMNKKDFIDIRSDMFSLGIILLELHLGLHPFDPIKVGNKNSIAENIIHGLYVPPSVKKGTSIEFVHLISRLLKSQPFQRFRKSSNIKDYVDKYWR